jgi:hypothetical protein
VVAEGRYLLTLTNSGADIGIIPGRTASSTAARLTVVLSNSPQLESKIVPFGAGYIRSMVESERRLRGCDHGAAIGGADR